MPLTKKQTEQALKNSIKDGAAFSAMDGMTSTYTTPFALALGANNAEVGILNSIPNFFATILQIFAGKYIEKRGRKKVAVNLSIIQRFTWLFIAIIPLIFFEQRLWLFILLVTISYALLSFASTAWSAWIGNIVPEKIRGSFFGKRNTIQSALSFFTTLLGGWILGLTNNLIGFSLVFFIAFVFGLIAYSYLIKIPEVSIEGKHNKNALNVLGFVKKFKKYRNFYPFTIHMSLMSFAVNIASPFFTVYMLNVLKVGYEWYAIVIAVEVLMRIFMQTYWGRISDKYGDRAVLIICNILIVFYPFCWFFVTNPFQIIFISIFSGIGWAGFDLASFNYLLDVTPPDERPSYISRYKIFTGMALFLGALAGGFLAQYSSNLIFLWFRGLQIVFLASFILRGLFSIYGISGIQEVRVKSEVLPVKDVFLKAFTTYPTRGISNELVYIHDQIGTWRNNVRRKIKNNLKEIV